MPQIPLQKMNENLELRKERAREFLKDAYSPKDKKWYQSKYPTYELITGFLKKNNKNYIFSDAEIILKNDLKGALFMSAFFVTIIVGMCVLQKEINVGFIFFLGGWIIFILANGLDRRPKLILNTKSIWAKNFENAIPWENVIAIYFKIIDSGDSLFYSFLVHYYDAKYDYFKEIEFSASGYGISNEEIIAAIKFFSQTKN
jgi:hypothetical protein